MTDQDIAYVLPLFPKVSETFIINEVDRLQSEGIDVLPISIDESDALEETRHERASSLEAETEYAMDYPPGRFVLYTFWFLVLSPRRFFETVLLNWRFGALPSVSRLGRLYKAIIVARLVEETDTEHIHGHWTLPSNTALLAAHLTGRSFSFTLHAHDIYEELPALAEDRDFPSAQYKIERAEFIFTCTARNRDHLKSEFDLAAEKVIHVYHGVDIDQFTPSERPATVPPQLLSIGRLVGYKGFDRVVDACGELRDREREFGCFIVGDGPEYDSLERQISERGLADTVSMTGYLPHDVVCEMYDQAEVYVFAGSQDEGHYGLPNVLIEAAAMELPIVTTRMPAISELVSDGVNGIILDDREPETIADAVEELLRDPELRAEMGERSREVVADRFDIEKTLEPLVETFQDRLGREEEAVSGR